MRDYTQPVRHSGGSSKQKTSSQFFQKIAWWLTTGLVGVGLVGLGWWWLQSQLAQFWPLHDSVTLVIVDPNSANLTSPLLIQLQPESQTMVLVALPADQMTELFSGYGQYKLAAVYPLLMLDHRSPAYIRATFSAISSSLVTEVVPWSELAAWQTQVQKTGILADPTKSNAGENLHQLGKKPLAALTHWYWEKVWSPGSSWSDRVQNLQAWKVIWQWRWFTEQTRLRWVWTTDPKSLLTSSGPTADQCPIAVVNATEIKGLAQQISTVLTANGYSIVRTTVDPTTSEQSHVWLDPALAKTCESVASRVSTILPTAPNPEKNDQQPKRYRAPIVITVGGDIAE